MLIFRSPLVEMKKIITESNVQVEKWFVCVQGQQCPRSHGQGHGQEVGRGINVPCLAHIKPYRDVAQRGALQHRHTAWTRGLIGLPWGKAAGAGLAPMGSEAPWGTLHPSGHSEEGAAACTRWGARQRETGVREIIQSGCQKKTSSPEEGEAVAQVTLGGCAGFISGGFQGLSSLVWPCICPRVSRRFSWGKDFPQLPSWCSALWWGFKLISSPPFL